MRGSQKAGNNVFIEEGVAKRIRSKRKLSGISIQPLSASKSLATTTSINITETTTINSNTVWDSDVYLTAKVYVEGAYLWLMPGIHIINDSNGGIVVRNHGIIKAVGNPYQDIVFDTNGPGYPNDYEFAIKIEETASHLCEIRFCQIYCAEKGIWIQNKRLEEPISNICIDWCYDGIWQEGPNLTDVIVSEIIDCYDDGVEVHLGNATDPNIASNKTYIMLEHLTP